MRVAIVLAALAWVAAASAVPYPARPADAPLLARAPTADEQLAELVAGRLTRQPVAVRCTIASEAPGLLGATPIVDDKPRGYFLLMPIVCRQLTLFRSNPRVFDPARCSDNACLQRLSRMVQALDTVAHESYHTLGFQAEATAECYGMQSLWYVANRLGASVRLSESLAAWYWRFQYPGWKLGSHREYWSAQCRDGGELDLRPRSHAWPS